MESTALSGVLISLILSTQHQTRLSVAPLTEEAGGKSALDLPICRHLALFHGAEYVSYSIYATT